MTIMAAPPFKNLFQNRIVIVLANLFGSTECPEKFQVRSNESASLTLDLFT